MVLTVVLVHNSDEAAFEAYQCRRMSCTRHYTVERGYFDITNQLASTLRTQQRGTTAVRVRGETLFVRWSDGGSGHVYERPVAGCDFTQLLRPYGYGNNGLWPACEGNKLANASGTFASTTGW